MKHYKYLGSAVYAEKIQKAKFAVTSSSNVFMRKWSSDRMQDSLPNISDNLSWARH